MYKTYAVIAEWNKESDALTIVDIVDKLDTEIFIGKEDNAADGRTVYKGTAFTTISSAGSSLVIGGKD